MPKIAKANSRTKTIIIEVDISSNNTTSFQGMTLHNIPADKQPWTTFPNGREVP
jgi:hypothetical protein